MKVLVALIGWIIGIILGAMVGGFVIMLVIGGIFPELGYWEWVRISFVLTWLVAGGTSLNAVKTARTAATPRRTI